MKFDYRVCEISQNLPNFKEALEKLYTRYMRPTIYIAGSSHNLEERLKECSIRNGVYPHVSVSGILEDYNLIKKYQRNIRDILLYNDLQDLDHEKLIKLRDIIYDVLTPRIILASSASLARTATLISVLKPSAISASTHASEGDLKFYKQLVNMVEVCIIPSDIPDKFKLSVGDNYFAEHDCSELEKKGYKPRLVTFNNLEII